MKLLSSKLIQENEKEFIDTINATLDWDAIERMLLEKYRFSVQNDVMYKDGNLIVHDNDIAYKFDFEIKLPISVVFNRDGDCLDVSTPKAEDDANDSTGREATDPAVVNQDGNGIKNRTEDIVSEIVDMISEING